MKVKQAKEICAANFPNSVVIFNFKTYRPFVLNDTAALVWKFCQRPRTLEEISRFLTDKFKINSLKAKKDAKYFIRQLQRIKLVVDVLENTA